MRSKGIIESHSSQSEALSQHAECLARRSSWRGPLNNTFLPEDKHAQAFVDGNCRRHGPTSNQPRPSKRHAHTQVIVGRQEPQTRAPRHLPKFAMALRTFSENKRAPKAFDDGNCRRHGPASNQPHPSKTQARLQVIIGRLKPQTQGPQHARKFCAERRSLALHPFPDMGIHACAQKV